MKLVLFANLPVLLVLIFNQVDAVSQDDPSFSDTEIEFFENRIRPVLVEHCYECHNSSDAAESGLALDYRDGVLDGGDGGPVVDLSNAAESRLLATIRHEIDGLEMPENGPKLDDQVISDFEKWIALGLPDPRTEPPNEKQLAAETSWEATLERRKEWWSFRPIKNVSPPSLTAALDTGHPVDSFIRAKLDAQGLAPAPAAEVSTLVRRLYITLIGLPPGPLELIEWTQAIERAEESHREQVIERLVDELLDSPHFGERWARHWMDWIRYAESHGSEGDPRIDNAWHYRDYLIRALNQDVPFDQLVREHMAGDLLVSPRINLDQGINESIIGTAHWRMVFHGFAPTDALDERVRFTDDQINVVTKAFLGLTVSCARCHDHKFDAISQADYYSMFGILASGRPARQIIDLPERTEAFRSELDGLKPEVRNAIATDWLAALGSLEQEIKDSDRTWEGADKPTSVLFPLTRLRQVAEQGGDLSAAWDEQLEQHRLRQASIESVRGSNQIQWNLAQSDDYRQWYLGGNGLTDEPAAPGSFSIAPEGDLALIGVYPAGAYSHLTSLKHAGRISSPDFDLSEDSELWVRVIGGPGSAVRYVVQDYPRNGTVYPVTGLNNNWRWQRYDLTYWTGDQIHVEVTAGKDAPLLVNNQDRSWIGVREAILIRKGAAAPIETHEHLTPIYRSADGAPPESIDAFASRMTATLQESILAWREGTANDSQAELLDACIRQGILPNQLADLPQAAPVVQRYRELESQVLVPTRIPGLEETQPVDQPLFIRGDHRRPGEPVPRRFLEAIADLPYSQETSGRLEFAHDILDSENPLTRRVLVNRIWHHLFGRGIVSTPDNFGRLGSLPTHPDLLDWLALRFENDGWSLKSLAKLIVMSKTWQQSSLPSEKATRTDPGNLFLSHAHVRRLEAEAIRDSMLATANRLDRELFGPPTSANSNRRTVYTNVIRNSLDPFLRVFDFPEPFSAVGRRDATNVPAQSLTLLNDERVIGNAQALAQRILEDPDTQTDEERLQRLFLTALGREAKSDEISKAAQYLQDCRNAFETQRAARDSLIEQRDNYRATLNELIEPIRERLLAELDETRNTDQQSLPAPFARWDFESDLRDAIGEAHGMGHNGAAIIKGELVVASGKHVITSPLKKTIRAKTLEAWVRLDNLEQRGGGVITIQTPDGRVFDSIVFGEKDPREWLAGSNNFARTESFQGPVENEATGVPIHFAIAYHEDGRIVGYRNGVQYGESYQSNGPVEFRSGEAVLSFGVRHLPATGNRMLAGQILAAQIYDRALSAEEIALSSGSAEYFVSERNILDAMDEDTRSQVGALKASLQQIETQIEALGPLPDASESGVWSELAHAMFMLKEFIYIR